MTKKTSYLEREIEHINNTITKLKTTNTKLNNIILVIMVLFVIILISNLNGVSMALILLCGLIYYIFSIQIKYNKVKKELDKVNSKFSKRQE